MRIRSLLAVFALVGFAQPALAQDGTPWGETSGSASRPAPAEDDKAEESSEEDETEDEADEDTVSGKRTAAADAPPALEMAKAGTPVTRIEIALAPEVSPPGGEVQLTVIFWSDDDEAVPGVTFDLLGKSGEVGEVVEKDGRYTATFTVSLYAEDEAKVSVITDSGLHEIAKIPVEGDPVEAGAVADADTDAEPEPKPAKEKVVKEPKEAKDKAPAGPWDPMWLHVSAKGVGGLYSYTQDPEGDSGPLIEDTLAFAGARSAGGEIAVSYWFEDLEYLGVQGDLRFMGYAVESNAFSGAAADFLYDGGLYAVGRIPVEVGSGQAWAGARLGFHYDDFMIFEGCLAPGCRVEFSTISMPGLGIGPRGGIELGSFFAEAGYTASLGRFTQPYNNALDLTAGYIVAGPVSAELSFDQVGRTIALQGKESGDVRARVTDSQSIFGLGVGAVF